MALVVAAAAEQVPTVPPTFGAKATRAGATAESRPADRTEQQTQAAAVAAQAEEILGPSAAAQAVPDTCV